MQNIYSHFLKFLLRKCEAKFQLFYLCSSWGLGQLTETTSEEQRPLFCCFFFFNQNHFSLGWNLSLQSGSHTKAGQWLTEDGGRGKHVWPKEHKESFGGVTKISYLPMVALVSWVRTSAQTRQIVGPKWMHFIVHK